MTDKRAQLTFDVGQHTFTHGQIVNVRFRDGTIGTITPSKTGIGLIVWSLRRLKMQTRDEGGPGNGIEISFVGDDDDDDDDPRSH